MLNLEQSILEWRRQMLEANIKSPVPLDELESHLRDEIEQQVSLGLSEEQGFKAAVQNIGPAPTLQKEFRKVEEIKEGREEKLNKILLAVGSVTVPLSIVWIVCFEAKDLFPTATDKVFALFPGGFFSLLPWFGLLNYWRFPTVRDKRKRYIITFWSFGALLVWIAIFSYIILPRYDFTMGRVFVAFLWASLVPTAALGALILGMQRHAKSTTD